jgi:hypothetical protein
MKIACTALLILCAGPASGQMQNWSLRCDIDIQLGFAIYGTLSGPPPRHCKASCTAITADATTRTLECTFDLQPQSQNLPVCSSGPDEGPFTTAILLSNSSCD